MRLRNTISAVILAVLGIFLSVSAQAQRTATAIPTVVSGFVVTITVTDGGSGYTNAPLVTISGGGGSSAVAIATVLNGSVDKVIVKNAGSDYRGTPIVVIDAPPSPKQPFSDSLVAYYPFDGNADDESGNGDNGTVFGATLTIDRFGRHNSAYYFNVTNLSAINCAGANLPLGAAARTICLWLKPDDIPLSNKAIYTEVLQYGTYNAGNGEVVIQLIYQTTHAWITPAIGTEGFTWYKSIDVGNFDKWVHCTWVVQDNRHVTFYVNGVAQTLLDGYPSPTAPGFGTIQGPLSIGYGQNMFYNGGLDDIRIYSRVLSDQEVKDLYAYESTEPPSLSIKVKTVQVTMSVKPTKKYLLMSSLDLKTWTNAGQIFVANTSEVVQEFDTTTTGRYFRLSEVP